MTYPSPGNKLFSVESNFSKETEIDSEIFLLNRRRFKLSKCSALVRALTSFHFNVFLKRFDMLSQCLTLSVTKKVISYSLVLGQQPLKAL